MILLSSINSLPDGYHKMNSKSFEKMSSFSSKGQPVVTVNGKSWCFFPVSYLQFCLHFRFLVGNKSDLRDPRCSDSQVSQERAVSFSKARNMMFFETSAKNSSNASSSDGSNGKVQYQQHHVEDIVVAVAAKLKRQRKSSIVNSPSQNGSFRIGNRKTPEKEAWTCC